MVECKSQDVSMSDENKIDFLRKNWQSHDARWQMEVVKNFGWEVGNKINQAVIRDIGKVMMFRMMKIKEMPEVTNIKDLSDLILSIVRLNFPPPSNVYQLLQLSNSTLCIKCQKCSTYDNIKKAKATNHYECGCFSLREGFFSALNLTLEQELKNSLMKGDDECTIILNVKEWKDLIESQERAQNEKEQNCCIN